MNIQCIYVVTLFVIIIHGCNQYDFEPTRHIISFLNRSRSRGCKHSVSYDIWEFGQCPKQGDRTPTHGVTVSGVSCKQRVLDCRRHFGQIGVEWTIGAHLSNCPCNQNNYVPLYKSSASPNSCTFVLYSITCKVSKRIKSKRTIK